MVYAYYMCRSNVRAGPQPQPSAAPRKQRIAKDCASGSHKNATTTGMYSTTETRKKVNEWISSWKPIDGLSEEGVLCCQVGTVAGRDLFCREIAPWSSSKCVAAVSAGRWSSSRLLLLLLSSRRRRITVIVLGARHTSRLLVQSAHGHSKLFTRRVSFPTDSLRVN